MIVDRNKEITGIDYNRINLPTKINFYDSDVGNKNISYLYTSGGIKLRQQTKIGSDITEMTDYCGNIIYKDSSLAFILMPEGRVLVKSEELKVKNNKDNTLNSSLLTFNYFLTDHLGNTRSIVSDSGIVLEENAYYAFGMQINELSFSSTVPNNKYLYNGKELQTDFGLDWHDYGARFYDAQIGRWHAIDPMAESYYSWSPYNYVANSPMIFIDPDGMELGWVVTKDGVEWDDNVHNQEEAKEKYGDDAQYAGEKDVYISEIGKVHKYSRIKDGNSVSTEGNIEVTSDGQFEVALNKVFVTASKSKNTKEIKQESKFSIIMGKGDDLANKYGPNIGHFILNSIPFYAIGNAAKTMITGKDIMKNEKKGIGQRYISPIISAGIAIFPSVNSGAAIIETPIKNFLDYSQQKTSENIYNDNQ